MGSYLSRFASGALALGLLLTAQTAVAEEEGVVVTETETTTTTTTETTEVAVTETEPPAVTEQDGDSAAEAYGLAYARRSLIMPKGMVRGTFDVVIGDLGFDTSASINIGGAVSVLDGIELGLSRYRMGSYPEIAIGDQFGGAGLIAFFVSPDTDFGDIYLYGRFGVTDGDVDVAFDVRFILPTQTDFGVLLGLPVRFHAGNKVAVDTGVELSFNDVGGFNFISVAAPLALTVNVTEEAFLNINTGFSATDLTTEVAADPVFVIPAGFKGGYTIEVADFMMDVFAMFQFPLLAAFSGGDSETTTDIWTLTFGLNFYTGVLW